VAADIDGPFSGLRLELDGTAVAFERWGSYFIRARVAPAPAGSILQLIAERASGEPLRSELELPAVR
jgi:hypothetical protein